MYCYQQKNILGARRGFAMMEISEQPVLEAISYARLLVKKATKAKWFLNELGLYLLLVGKEEHWKPFINEIQADKTGMHSVDMCSLSASTDSPEPD